MNRILTLTLLLLFSTTTIAQIGRLSLSPRQTVEQNIAKSKITIDYSRPHKRDREIFGSLVPYDKYWRTGANQNTTIEFSDQVSLNGVDIKKGKYAIITKPQKDDWEFILYAETSNWDVPNPLDESKIVCKITVPSIFTTEQFDVLSISIDNFTNYDFDLIIRWDKTKVVVPFKLSTKKIMDDLIKDELEGPQAGDYYSAAIYQLESEKYFEKGHEWITKAIEIREEPKWYDYRARALLLIEMKRFKEAKKDIDTGLKMATEIENKYGISEFNKMLDTIKK